MHRVVDIARIRAVTIQIEREARDLDGPEGAIESTILATVYWIPPSLEASMNNKKVFRIESSPDGKSWTFDTKDDDENYPWLARKAKDRSTTSGGYERIVRVDMNHKVIITYRDAISIFLKSL